MSLDLDPIQRAVAFFGIVIVLGAIAPVIGLPPAVGVALICLTALASLLFLGT